MADSRTGGLSGSMDGIFAYDTLCFSMGKKGSKHVKEFGVVAFAFKDSSSAELFYSMIRRRRRRRIWVHASNESIRRLLQRIKSIAKTNYLIGKASWW